MNSLKETIAANPFFFNMKPEHLDIVVQGAVPAKFVPGKILFREGEPANQFYLIEAGKIALEAHEPAGGTRLVQYVGAGEVLGWSWLFSPFSWHFQARVVDPTEAIVLNGGHLLVAAEENRDFGYELMKRVTHVVIQRLAATRYQILPSLASAATELESHSDSASGKAPAPDNNYLKDAIAKHPFWSGLDPRYLHFLDECASLERYGLNQYIFHGRSQADRLCLIIKGRVSLETFVPEKGNVSIQTLGPGDALGWSWLFPPHEWQFSARALETCELISFGAAGLRARSEENHEFAYELVTRVARMLLQRLQATRRRLIQFYQPVV